MGIEDVPAKRRCIFLLLMVKGRSRENAGTAARCVDSRPSNVRTAMGSRMVVAITVTVRAIQAMASQARCAISVA